MENKLYALSLNISKKVEKTITGYKFNDDLNKIIAMSLFELSRQHFNSILVLLDKNFNHSAGALLRPIIETHYRAQWIMFIADETQVKNISNGSIQFPKITKIAKSLDKQFNTKSFSKEGFKHLHDLTHGGIEQILRFIDNTSIQSCYSSQDIDYILETSTKNICFFLSTTGLFLEDDNLLKLGNKMIIDFDNKIKEQRC